nr:acyloxyacyl hydrolase [Flavobacterium sp. K5-23]
MKESKRYRYDLSIQPEINFAKYQSDNVVSSNLIMIREYILNLGFKMSKPITDKCNVYLQGSIGPMISDKVTYRLSKGFSFSDVLAIGITFKANKVSFDLKPSFRHTSNASIQKINFGYNIINVEFGVYFPL